jgi:UDP-N-acetylglucosamine diphosphorylase / glucose-1-phosphate thymidylyltransferase / UDP-N-acetylgalactosamine diphosphorylase / glucosamine-1-phosphate N-acetyltransferase / galactosamine-1-phosphate N-acetyltransferase
MSDLQNGNGKKGMAVMMAIKKCVILAGGAGTRIAPLAVNKPKPMFRIMGKPLVQHVIEAMKDAGVREFIVVVGHESEKVKEFLGDGSALRVKVRYTIQEEALGMANALLTAEGLIKKEEQFLVVNANDIFEPKLIRSMIEKQKSTGAGIVMSCRTMQETWKYGILSLEGDRIKKLVEKPPKGKEPSNLAVIGAYILPGKIFDVYRKVGVSDKQYEDAIQRYIDNGGDARAVLYKGFFGSFKHPWDLLTLNEHIMKTRLTAKHIPRSCKISPRATIEGNVWLGENVTVFEGAVLKGPCYVGDDSVIGTNALFYNYSSCGKGCVIGFSCEVKDSMIGDGCWFHKSYVGDTVMGDGCSMGAGSVTANYRFDESNVNVNIKGEKVDTGRIKFGAIIGDNVKFGVNCSTLPGVKAGPNCIVGPGVVLQDDLEPNKMIFLDKTCCVVKERSIVFTSNQQEELLRRLQEERKPKKKLF